MAKKGIILLIAAVIMLIALNSLLIMAFNANGKIYSNENGIRLTQANSLSSGNDDLDDENEREDVPVTGSALERASAVALAHIGEGRITDSEIGDEQGYYEIEITLDDGNEVDVHLDETFNVLSTEYEDEEDDY